MKGIGYSRCSTRGQYESLHDQEALVKQFCDSQGVSLKAVYRDVSRSGKTFNPSLKEAVAALNKGEYDVLVSTFPDRITRSWPIWETIKEQSKANGWRIMFSEFSGDVDNAIKESEAELVKLSARTKSALRAKKLAGVTLGAPVLVSANVETEILMLRYLGESMHKIARFLNDTNTPTSNGGKQWYASTVRVVLNRRLGA